MTGKNSLQSLRGISFAQHIALIIALSASLSTVPGASAQEFSSDLLDKYQEKVEKRELTDQELSRLAELAQAYKDNARVHLVYGLALDLVGLNDQALEQFKLSDKLGPKDSQAVVGIIHHLLSRGDKAAAKAMLDQAMERFPNDANVLYVLGRTLLDDKHGQEAESVLWRAYGLPNRPVGVAVSLAELIMPYKPELAVQYAQEDLKRQPDNRLGLAVLTEAYFNLGEYRKALAPAARIFALDPFYRNCADLYARSLYWNGQYRQGLMPALYCLARQATYMGGNMPASEVIAQISQRVSSRDLSQALEEFYQKTIGSGKDIVRTPFYYYLAQALSRAGHHEQALAQIDRFLAADPRCVDAILFKGRLQETKLGDYQGALASYRLAHALLPYNPVCDQALVRLEERMSVRESDLAWLIRDGLRRLLNLPPI
ncbi:MAG TPA: tetratricopeptide repeat protein [Candidatus Obscuribacter sp.]|nr:tetratricopeptide repeat protein [Candidatus Obscuribacter sp.]HNG76209.1 tetratricopeptide repeat protein [Candidatus Obscuribacter sp.]